MRYMAVCLCLPRCIPPYIFIDQIQDVEARSTLLPLSALRAFTPTYFEPRMISLAHSVVAPVWSSTHLLIAKGLPVLSFNLNFRIIFELVCSKRLPIPHVWLTKCYK